MLYLNSQVLTLNIIDDTYPPTEQIIGVPFATQPIVQILDYYGQPLQNKYVIALSSPEPFLPIDGVASSQAAYLDGNYRKWNKNLIYNSSSEVCIFKWRCLRTL